MKCAFEEERKSRGKCTSSTGRLNQFLDILFYFSVFLT